MAKSYKDMTPQERTAKKREQKRRRKQRDRMMLAGLRMEYIVCGARGYPDPLQPHPNNKQTVRRFVADHGGYVRQRRVSDWETVDINKLDKASK